jgi:hypothetical protein
VRKEGAREKKEKEKSRIEYTEKARVANVQPLHRPTHVVVHLRGTETDQFSKLNERKDEITELGANTVTIRNEKAVFSGAAGKVPPEGERGVPIAIFFQMKTFWFCLSFRRKDSQLFILFCFIFLSAIAKCLVLRHLPYSVPHPTRHTARRTHRHAHSVLSETEPGPPRSGGTHSRTTPPLVIIIPLLALRLDHGRRRRMTTMMKIRRWRTRMTAKGEEEDQAMVTQSFLYTSSRSNKGRI